MIFAISYFVQNFLDYVIFQIKINFKEKLVFKIPWHDEYSPHKSFN